MKPEEFLIIAASRAVNAGDTGEKVKVCLWHIWTTSFPLSENFTILINCHARHAHTHREMGKKKICIWNARGVLSHLPPNSHAENLRQIFILRPVSSLIQSKWMQQQTNLSNPTSKQPCSLSRSLSPCELRTDIAEERSEGGEEEAWGGGGRGGIVDRAECMTPPAGSRKALGERESVLAATPVTCKLRLTSESKLLLRGLCLIHGNITLLCRGTVNVRSNKMKGNNY